MNNNAASLFFPYRSDVCVCVFLSRDRFTIPSVQWTIAIYFNDSFTKSRGKPTRLGN